MPRVAGQIDLSKNEAILDAAVEVMGERGFAAPMEEIARRACVSKQTVYNHYGSKAELVRAVVERRVDEITAPLEEPEAVEHPAEALAGFARAMLSAILKPQSTAFMRMAIEAGGLMPDVAQVWFDAGPRASRERLAHFLTLEVAAGRLAVDDPMEAAEFFAGMVIGSYQTAALIGVNRPLDEAKIERVATEAAARFLRAYAV